MTGHKDTTISSSYDLTSARKENFDRLQAERREKLKDLELQVTLHMIKPVLDTLGMQYAKARQEFEDVETRVHCAHSNFVRGSGPEPTQADHQELKTKEDRMNSLEDELGEAIHCASLVAKIVVEHV